MENKNHETRDADVRRIALSGLFVAMVTMAIMALLMPLYRHYGRRDPAPASVPRQQSSGVPALQADPRQNLAVVRAREDVELQSYGWVDKGRGIVRIPIERAMDLLTERGLPTRPQTEAAR